MNKVWELNRVLNKEDRGVIADHVVVTVLSIMFDCETARVTIAVVGTSFTGDSGESQENRGFLSNLVQKLSTGETNQSLPRQHVDKKNYV